MRKSILILAALFIVITLFRVATFSRDAMQAGWMGWVFSIGLGAAVFITAYWTRISAAGKDGTEDRRSRNTRIVSWFALVLFAAADGFFNWNEVVRTTKPDTDLMRFAVGVYGVFPTLAAALLGMLKGFVDRVPKPPAKKNVTAIIARWLWQKFEQVFGDLPDEEEPAVVLKVTKPEPPALPSGKTAWRELSPADRARLPGMTAAQIAERWHVSERSARDWRKKARVE